MSNSERKTQARLGKRTALSEQTSVMSAIKAALKELALHDPVLAQTLRTQIKGRKVVRYKPR